MVRAELGSTGLWTPDGVSIDIDELPLSVRLVDTVVDWMAFFDDVGGELSDRDIREEFVGQGYKIAHALRRELKGSQIWFSPPHEEDLVAIELRRQR